MKRIGIVLDNDLNSDVRVLKELEILKKYGFQLHVLCFGYYGKTYEEIEGVEVTRLPMKKRHKDIYFFLFNRLPMYEYIWTKAIKHFIEHNEFDCLHVHDLYMSRSAGRAIKASSKKLPLILDIHENFPVAVQYYNWTKGWMRGFLSNYKIWTKKEADFLRYPDKIIVLSDDFKGVLTDRYDFLKPEDVVVFPNVVDLRKFETFQINPAIKPTEKVTFMYFGGVAERRGIFTTIEVIKEAHRKGLNVDLLIIGPLDKADKAKFYDLTCKEEVKDIITYIPWIPISELLSYMHVSDVLLSPLVKNAQHESGVANKIFQYMYGAKPLIVSNCKPQKDLVEAFNCGLSYSTTKEYLDCVERLTLDLDLRLKMGANGRKMLYEKYDNEDYEQSLVQLY